ncbi:MULTISPECIES: MurR/RpiR family transcriptional regulator [unclassified Enterococcus]|jgi:DNA-binding MurR/RpiR family transcriptional regulator|uniref:MurR/RpiR family transcriptional regulator n=1 Tax=unclassified Enterococcus TaxID=2608891 RepID=UPI003D277E5C
MNDVILRINKIYDALTHNQKDIADFMIQNPELISSMTVKELAIKTFSVPSAIIKFSKKLGYSGFQELKFQFSSGQKIRSNEDKLLYPYSCVNKVITTSAYKKTVDLLAKTGKIYILAHQMSQIPAKDFYFKVHKVSPAKILFFQSFEEQLRNIPILQKNDVILMISNSGECEEIIQCLSFLPEDCCKILITNGIHSTISKHADLVISIGCLEEEELFFKEIPTYSRNALLFLLDHLFLDMIRPDLENNLKTIKNSSEFFINR